MKVPLEQLQLNRMGITKRLLVALAGAAVSVLGSVAGYPASILDCPNQRVLVGQTAVLSAMASGTPSLGYQWRRGGIAIVGATNATLTMSNVTFAAASDDYWVEVWDDYGGDDAEGIQLTVLPVCPIPGYVDATLQARLAGPANALLAQPDGRLLAGSWRVTRLWPDGTVDTNLVPNAGPAVSQMNLQPDGKVIVLTSGLCNGLSRLIADGTLDSSFAVDLYGGDPFVL